MTGLPQAPAAITSMQRVLVNCHRKRSMKRKIVPALAALLLTRAVLGGQLNVCDLFKDLKSSDGQQVIVSGELIIS